MILTMPERQLAACVLAVVLVAIPILIEWLTYKHHPRVPDLEDRTSCRGFDPDADG